MPLGGDIYRGFGNQFNMGQNVGQGMSLRAMADKRQLEADERAKQIQTENAYKKGIVIGEDGKMTQNRGRTLKELYAINPMLAQQQQDKWAAQDAQAQKSAMDQQVQQFKMGMQKADFTSRVLSSANDQDSWANAKSQLESQGIVKPGELPDMYDPDLKKSYLYRSLTAKERLDSEAKNRGLDLREQEIGLKRRELGLKGGLGKGKQLNPDKVLKVQEGAQIPTMLEDLKGILDQNQGQFGPVVGRAGQMNPYDVTAQTLDSKIRANSQAFGRYMEGGVLRKEDEEKYRKMFPNLTDTPAVAQNKLKIVQRLLVKRLKSDVGALKRAGYDVSPFDEAMQMAVPENPQALAGGQGGGMGMNEARAAGSAGLEAKQRRLDEINRRLQQLGN